jgi:tight adherence protein C
MAGVLSVLAGMSAMMLVLGLFRPNTRHTARRRIDRMQAPVRSRESLSFSERVLAPAAAQVTGLATLLLPSRLFQSTAQKLETAGVKIHPTRFVTGWMALGVFFPLLALIGSIAARGEITRQQLLGLTIWVAVGLAFPSLWLRMRARARTGAIDAALADAIDLIVTNVESGLGLQAAMINIAQKLGGPIALEFDRVIRETGVGRPREEALDAMARRTGSRDMQLFVRAIAQAERTGIPIANVLRGQAKELRERRRQLAREKANKIPLKITIPTVMFMFPTLFMLLLGPVILNALKLMGQR